MATDPILIRLPFWLVDHGFSLERLLARGTGMSWSQAWRLIPVFELSGPELFFAKEILTRKRNLWLFRCNQKALCGDFAVVDMSAAQPLHRKHYVMELKSGAPIQFDGKGAAGQLQNARKISAELQRLGLVGEPQELISGGEHSILAWLGAA